MIKFYDAVKISTGACSKCFSFIYTLPYKIDPSIQNFLVSFGSPAYPLKTVRLLRIDSNDGFHIEGKIGARNIKFVMPKEYKDKEEMYDKRKKEFESCIAKWLSSKLKIDIVG